MADEFGFGFSTGNPAGYVKAAIAEGWSASEALTTYRADGGQTNTQAWYRLYGEVGAAVDNAGVAQALDPFAIPNGADYSTWTMGTREFHGHASAIACFSVVLSRNSMRRAVASSGNCHRSGTPGLPSTARIEARSNNSTAAAPCFTKGSTAAQAECISGKNRKPVKRCLSSRIASKTTSDESERAFRADYEAPEDLRAASWSKRLHMVTRSIFDAELLANSSNQMGG